jgi:hypothetical protein
MIYFPFELVKIYQQERIEKADHYRLLEQIRAGEPDLPSYLFSKMSSFSVCLGLKLKKSFKQTLAILTQVEVRFEGWLRNRWIH